MSGKNLSIPWWVKLLLAIVVVIIAIRLFAPYF
jgi:hypothetical protein